MMNILTCDDVLLRPRLNQPLEVAATADGLTHSSPGSLFALLISKTAEMLLNSSTIHENSKKPSNAAYLGRFRLRILIEYSTESPFSRGR